MQTAIIKHHWFTITIIAILFLAVILRFYGYDHRWGLAYDQAHDALIAREAIRQHKLPLLGPFSSAGPFVTGPQWYWFIMLGTLLFPPAVITPWIILTLLSIYFVYLMICIGKHIGGTFFAISCGLLAAVSSAEIAQSINLTNQAPLSLLSGLSIFFILKYFQTKKLRHLFFIGLFISLGINTHLQGVLLLPLLVLPFVFEIKEIISQKMHKKDLLFFGEKILFALTGFILPCIPLIIFDTTHHFYDLRSMWQYYHHDQYAISLDQLGRNWKNYLGIFWPQSLAYITGGYVTFSYILIGLCCFVIAYTGYVKKISKGILLILLVFLISVIFMRYTRTPLFTSYLMFLHPWVFILVAWILTILFEKNKLVGIALLLLLVGGSLVKDIQDIHTASNNTSIQITQWQEELARKFPHKNFSLYDYQYKTTGYSAPLSLYLDAANKMDRNGMRIGVRMATSGAHLAFPSVSGKKIGLQIFILNSSSSAQLLKNNWYFINPNTVYHATEEWFYDKKL